MELIETPRLLLRAFTPADLDALADLNRDPEVLRFINGGRPIPREEVERDILPAFMTDAGRLAPFGVWAAVSRLDKALLGWFALRPTAHTAPGEVELGYRLRRAAWGQGLATEGARALVERGFSAWGAGRIFAQTMTVNRASRRVMEKAGLRYVRAFFADWPDVIEGGEFGDVEYALTRQDWQARGPAQ